jgi:hypothetical protein
MGAMSMLWFVEHNDGTGWKSSGVSYTDPQAAVDRFLDSIRCERSPDTWRGVKSAYRICRKPDHGSRDVTVVKTYQPLRGTP